MAKPDRSAQSMERLFEAIRSFRENNPDMRVGQILCYAADNKSSDPFYCENDALADALRKVE